MRSFIQLIAVSGLTLLLCGVAYADPIVGLADFPLGSEFEPSFDWTPMDQLADDGISVVETQSSYEIGDTDYPIDLVIVTRDGLITFTGVSFHDTSAAMRTQIETYFGAAYSDLHTDVDQTSVHGSRQIVVSDGQGDVAEMVSRDDMLSICWSTEDEYEQIIEPNGDFDSALADFLPNQYFPDAPHFPSAAADDLIPLTPN